MKFFDVITAAVADVTKRGYVSQAQIDEWTAKIRRAAEEILTPPDVLEASLVQFLEAVYHKQITREQIMKRHPGIPRWTLEQVKPKLRAELDRRIVASADLIRLNRKAMIEKTLQRFQGWATSIPPGGSKSVDKRGVKSDVRKALASLPFEERRVLVDQGHKFLANLSHLVATDGHAIAGIWHSHWRQANYQFREDHKERDGLVYAVRNNWAIERGLMTKGAGYVDEQTLPGEEIFCRCYYQWLYALRDLPESMLTAKGRIELKDAQARLAQH